MAVISPGEPCFAVVGHPNKGKSSVVAALARDDRIAISPRSGTTVRAERWSFSNAAGRYHLVDTPGFQRPRAVLDWLRQHAPAAHQRAEAVKALVQDAECQRRFPDEVELLRPIVAGAAILYVVDGSRPYSPEYEAEMEILRWSGRPSMGLINPIEGEAHVAEWQQALQQYFRVVQVFNPMEPRLEAQARLLEVFALLNPAWQPVLEAMAETLAEEKARREEEVARLLALWLDEASRMRVCQQVPERSLAEGLKSRLQARFRQQLAQSEQAVFQQLLALHDYRHTALEAESLDWPGELLDSSQWKLWGLNRKQLYAAAATAGASAGGVVDAALLGHSFLAGAVLGGLAGLGSAWWSSERLASARISALAGGRWEICAGPVADSNFPFVLLARFGWLYRQIRARTHAHRQAIRLQPPAWESLLQQLDPAQRKALFAACGRLSRQKTVDDLHAILQPVLQQFVDFSG